VFEGECDTVTEGEGTVVRSGGVGGDGPGIYPLGKGKFGWVRSFRGNWGFFIPKPPRWGKQREIQEMGQKRVTPTAARGGLVGGNREIFFLNRSIMKRTRKGEDHQMLPTYPKSACVSWGVLNK